MKTITLNLYEYGELGKKAQERALADRNEYHDDPLMQSHMINLLGEKLDEHGIKYGYGIGADPDVRYSLSYCQGDGFMFVGDFEMNGKRVTVTHGDPHYYHMYTARFDYESDDAKKEMTEPEQKAFEETYRAICKEMERIGYDHIEYEQSEERFAEECEANEYLFEEDGKRWTK